MPMIADNFFFDNGFVRTIVMRFSEGWTELNPVWTQLIGIKEVQKCRILTLYSDFGIPNLKRWICSIQSSK